MVILAVVVAAALLARLFFFVAPVLQGDVTMAQFIVAQLYRRAQLAMYLAHAVDQGLVAYHVARTEDRTCPKSLWMEVCQK